MKRQLRFNVRTLLIGVTVFTAFGGTELYHQSRQSNAVASLRRLPYNVVSYDFTPTGAWKPRTPSIRSQLAGIFRELTGSNFFNPVISANVVADEPSVLSDVAALRHLRGLQLATSGTGAMGGPPCLELGPLTHCKHLEYLVLGNGLTLRPDGAEGFNGTGDTILPLNIDDTHLAVLPSIHSLRVLVLGGSKVTDASVDELAMLRQLECLYLHSSVQLTPIGLGRLQKALPKCTIIQMDDTSRDYLIEIYSGS